MTWKVLGSSIDTLTVKCLVTAESVSADEAARIQQVGVLHGTQRRHRVGLNLPTYRFTFMFIGPAPDRYARMQAVRNILKSAESWTLEAPAAPNEFYFNAGVKSIRLSLDSLRIVYGRGIGAVGLEVIATDIDPQAGELLALDNVILAGAATLTMSKTHDLVVTVAWNAYPSLLMSVTQAEVVPAYTIFVGIVAAANGLSNGILRGTALPLGATGSRDDIRLDPNMTPSTAHEFVPLTEGYAVLAMDTAPFFDYVAGGYPVLAPEAGGSLSGLNLFPEAFMDTEAGLMAPTEIGPNATPSTSPDVTLYDPIPTLEGTPTLTPSASHLDNTPSGFKRTTTVTPSNTPTLTVT